MKNLQPTTYNLQPTEEGVTLVVAMVMLATVTFISFAISAVIIREIGVARVILSSEPAISGASSGGEVGLYRLFRALSETSSVSDPGQFQSGAAYEVSADLYDDNYVFSAAGGEEIKVALYDAENPENKQPVPRYASVTITNNPGGDSLQYRVNTWTLPDSDDAICANSVSAGSTSLTCSLPSTTDNRFVVFLQPSGGGSSTGFVIAYDATGQTIGIPSDSQKLDITGTAGTAERRIEIRVGN